MTDADDGMTVTEIFDVVGCGDGDGAELAELIAASLRAERGEAPDPERAEKVASMNLSAFLINAGVDGYGGRDMDAALRPLFGLVDDLRAFAAKAPNRESALVARSIAEALHPLVAVQVWLG